MRYIFKHFPLYSSHPQAEKASEAAECAGEQGAFWEMHDALFDSQGEWSGSQNAIEVFKNLAGNLELDRARFDDCLDSGTYTAKVTADYQEGVADGVGSTPTFRLNGAALIGAHPFETFRQQIDYYLAGGEPLEIVPSGEDFHVLGVLGPARAVTVAFVDYASTQSAQHALDVLPQLIETYVDAGDMIYVLHPWADGDDAPGAQAAAAAECAGQQDKYWEMHDQLFVQQATWTAAENSRSLFTDYAGSLGLDTGEFEACLDSDWAMLRVQAGRMVGALYGVPGAPIYLFNNGQALQEAPTLEEFQAQIDSILNR